jgi:sugar phosphate isomerase/epimerase
VSEPDAEAAAEPVIDWSLVQAEYEADEETLQQIADKYGIKLSALAWQAQKNRWPPRRVRGPVDRRTNVVTRLYRLIERQTIAMETVMTEPGDKEVAALGKLVTTLEKLIEIDERLAKGRAPNRQEVDPEGLRKKLAQRIDRLVKE